MLKNLLTGFLSKYEQEAWDAIGKAAKRECGKHASTTSSSASWYDDKEHTFKYSNRGNRRNPNVTFRNFWLGDTTVFWGLEGEIRSIRNFLVIMNLILFVVCSFFIFSCRGPEPDVPLVGGYLLGNFEANPGRQYFIVSKNQKVVVSPSIQSLAIDGDDIYGFLSSVNDKAFEAMPSGYFFLKTDSGNLRSGLRWETLIRELPSASKDSLAAAPNFIGR